MNLILPAIDVVALPPDVILHVWDQGQQLHPLDRALTVLDAACPDATRAQLAALPIGQRDALLLRLRRKLAGPRLEGQATCPSCRQRLEFPLNIDSLLALATPSDTKHQVTVEGFHLHLHLPDSRDLAAAVRAGEPAAGRRELIRRCLLAVHCEGRAWEGDLPLQLLRAVGAECERLDPLANPQLRLSCPHCDHDWHQALDVLEFVWTEIAARARRLLHQVHRLASAYGWSEQQILALPTSRRHAYLQWVV